MEWLDHVFTTVTPSGLLISGTIIGSTLFIFRTLRPVFIVMDILVGRPASFGQPASPGALERLTTVESSVKLIDAKLSVLLEKLEREHSNGKAIHSPE